MAAEDSEPNYIIYDLIREGGTIDSGPKWKPDKWEYPYDELFRGICEFSGANFTTADCLRLFQVNGFTEPEVRKAPRYGCVDLRECWAQGPDGKHYNGQLVLLSIFRAERLERLIQDRRDAVVSLCNQEDAEWFPREFKSR